MGDQFEDFRAYLPKYLSVAAQQELFAELKQFPANINQRLYTERLKGERKIFQGDGLRALPVTNLPDTRVQIAQRVMVVSNSCDVNVANRRLVGPRVMYCPIISLLKYEDAIRGAGNKIPGDHIENIKLQRLSSLFYLPAHGHLENSIALLDRIENHDLGALDVDDIATSRVFTLSDYGFYLFVFKISIHLTRIRESLQRS